MYIYILLNVLKISVVGVYRREGFLMRKFVEEVMCKGVLMEW